MASSCDDDFGLLGDDAPQTAAGAAAEPAPPPPPQTFCFGDSAAAGAGIGAGAGAGAGPLAMVAQEEGGNHSAERGKAAGHGSKRGRDRGEELSDGGEYCSYINSSGGGGGGGGGSGKKGRGGGSGGAAGSWESRKDREEWTDGAISSLLDSYTDRFEQLNRGNLRGRDWEDVAAAVTDGQGKVGKSVEQCKNKIDNLKKRYKVECQRLASTGGGTSGTTSHWPWFRKMEQIVGNPSSPSSSKALVASDDDKSRQPQQHSSKRYAPSGSGTPTLGGGGSKLAPLPSPKWKRVLLKIGGTALAGAAPQNVDPKVIMLIAREVQVACRHGVEVSIVVGGRNIFCGDTWVSATGTDRASTYPIGMMASVMNAVLLQASLEKIGVETRVQTALTMQEVAEPYIRRRAIRHLEKGRVVIFAGIGAGIGNPLFTTDTAAALRASEIVIFNMLEPGNISKAICGDQVGTLVDQSGRIT
uniref:UMP kinase n=1 Tax=Leersia perrieri TaxID=77586 RepID=A0A0D9W4J9_9ORYZ